MCEYIQVHKHTLLSMSGKSHYCSECDLLENHTYTEIDDKSHLCPCGKTGAHEIKKTEYRNYVIYACSQCNYTDKHEHSYISAEDIHKCTTCGMEEPHKFYRWSGRGHSCICGYEEMHDLVVKEKKGYTETTCSKCNYKKHTHAYSYNTDDTYVCSTCQKETPHDLVQKNAKEHTCSLCGFTEAHDIKKTTSRNRVTYKCSECSYYKVERRQSLTSPVMQDFPGESSRY